MKKKALVLLSGGLDSTLATRIISDQEVEVECINFISLFCTCTPKGRSCLASRAAADKLGIKLKVMKVGKEYLEIVKNPKHGYGSEINPCLDCRIYKFSKAREYMKKIGASFIVTGEVLGQRPMSQRKKAMEIIEKESKLEDLILRPLSAKLFPPTKPEREGVVDRKKLLKIHGRSRKSQIKLAKNFNIKDYPCPSGGCRLTEPGFSRRMKDLIKYKPDFTLHDVKLLKLGRHFRLTPKSKLIVGRNKEENNTLLKLVKRKDLIFRPDKLKGPISIGKGFRKDNILKAAQIIARYCKNNSKPKKEILYSRISEYKNKSIKVSDMEDKKLSSLRI